MAHSEDISLSAAQRGAVHLWGSCLLVFQSISDVSPLLIDPKSSHDYQGRYTLAQGGHQEISVSYGLIIERGQTLVSNYYYIVKIQDTVVLRVIYDSTHLQ